MGTGRLSRVAATAGVVALTLGAGTLAITTLAAATTTMTATTYVNQRSGPSTSYPVLGVLSPGQAVEASGTVTNGWVQVTTNATTGWVYKTYLAGATAPTPPTTTPAPTASGTVVTTAAVNVRSGPGTAYGVVGVAPKGLQLATTGRTSNGWVQVLYDGVARWIAGNYLTTPSAASVPSLPAVTGQLRTTASLYLRTAGELSAPSDGLVAANTVVDATGRTTAEYSEIVFQGKVRWIATRYTAVVTATSPTAPPAPATAGTVYVTVNALNVRATSEAGSTIVGVVSRGTALPTTGATTADRTQVVYLGTARWVYSPYVSETAPATATALAIPAGITTSGMTQLNANAKAVVQHVIDAYPKIRTIYGWRASSAYSSDHPNGRAVDIMIPSWTDPAMAEYGWAIAKDFAAHAKTYKVNYVIYRQSVFNAAYPERGWRPMEDRGSATANHYDHVHVSVFD